YSFLSFFNVTKYPPSLLFSLVTLGILLLILAIATGRPATAGQPEARESPLSRVLLVYGRPPGAGLSLGAVYAIWAAVVIALYPLCRWYGRYKAAHREKTWLRYL